MYQHQEYQGGPISLPVGKVACIGRNYLDHIEEMKSVVSESPLLFLKPKAALCDMATPLVIPTNQGECHNELEVAVLLKYALCKATEAEVLAAIWGIGLGLDLTLRDVQRELKAQGQPWERAKSFDLSCPVSGFVPIDSTTDLQDLHFTLSINGEIRQSGHTAMMLHKIVPLIAHMSQTFTLDAGDVVLTGTPKGVGPLLAGDTIEATLHDKITVNTKVVR
ncbi:fumarylacetoacetate hydrolase family protein [Alteromonas sp. CI.11.F.A3]|uniref:fumarylacetoacetate hydrolase family protein n=1 Tax=Alteromonas sp. CI.11.F.A3 TaxID=3079555 RepID=UPI002942C7A6|nr:fumarylacetoacetate hydrolase family protein [Alteromonas sp. CI.11.F.A3]WOI38965.1 fumarylacetoacetate hydrolase family protein [Alteromonas sp. CI.11.F.A3]